MKRIVSLVPSWTETLVEAGAHVVGRTRFCIHPEHLITGIEAVGGTKSFDEKKLRALKPDLILLDREENTREMSALAQTIAPLLVTHVETVRDLPRELRALAVAVASDESPNDDHSTDRATPAARLREMALRYEAVLALKKPALHKTQFVYCIWKDPWMAAGRNTFIGSMLEQVGYDLDLLWPSGVDKYPKFKEDEMPMALRVLLSSEPYPFEKRWPQLRQSDVRLVDGESFSWFGLRALRFLESQKSAPKP